MKILHFVPACGLARKTLPVKRLIFKIVSQSKAKFYYLLLSYLCVLSKQRIAFEGIIDIYIFRNVLQSNIVFRPQQLFNFLRVQKKIYRKYQLLIFNFLQNRWLLHSYNLIIIHNLKLILISVFHQHSCLNIIFLALKLLALYLF